MMTTSDKTVITDLLVAYANIIDHHLLPEVSVLLDKGLMQWMILIGILILSTPKIHGL